MLTALTRLQLLFLNFHYLTDVRALNLLGSLLELSLIYCRSVAEAFTESVTFPALQRLHIDRHTADESSLSMEQRLGSQGGAPYLQLLREGLVSLPSLTELSIESRLSPLDMLASWQLCFQFEERVNITTCHTKQLWRRFF